jgi:hypothetical protein
VHGNEPAVNPALQHRNLTVAHTDALRIDRVNEEHAALVTADKNRHIVHPRIVAAWVAPTNQ